MMDLPVEIEGDIATLEETLDGENKYHCCRCSPRAPRLIRNRIAMPDLKTRVMPSWISGQTASLKLKSISWNSGIAQWSPGSNLPEGSTSFESAFPRLLQLLRILEDGASSDNSSIISSNFDEGSCSTDTTRDSTSTDDFFDYIYGYSRRGWSITWQNSFDSDTSSSSSSTPLGSKHSSLADLEHYNSAAPQTNGHRADAAKEDNPNWDGITKGRSK